MFRNLVLCLCCLFLAACVGREQSSAPPPADFVSTTLGHAAEQAHGELAMIARLRGQGLQPLLLPSDPSLNLPATRLSLQGSGNTLRTGHDRGGAWAEPSRA